MGNDYKNDLEQRKKIAQDRKTRNRKKHTQAVIMKSVLLVVLLAVLGVCIFLVFRQMNGNKSQTEGNDAAVSGTDTESSEVQVTEQPVEEDPQTQKDTLIAQADYMAAGYDYDGAIALIQTYPDYANDSQMTEKIAGYEATKATCVAIDVDTVPHIFYHSLIADPSLAFDGDEDSSGYNTYMTTISEFDKITQAMYDAGYVVVRLRDLVVETTDEQGNTHFEKNTNLLLPSGKKAVVISVDDLSYYHYMEGDGFPDKIVADENGLPKCQMTLSDGTVSIGDYDVVPRLNTFLTEHPDGAYKGARGMIALTGYNGVLGYRTDTDYRDRLSLQANQEQWLNEHPDFNFEQEVADAKVAADAVKASGWEFASHTWGHQNVSTKSLDLLMEDNEKWKNTVEPIVGSTDLIIFAFGADLGDWHEYSTDNEKYNYFYDQGFRFFCNVDSSPYWVQITDSYVRQGRRNLDGYLMYKSMTVDNNLEDLFHVEDVFDSVRPTPVMSPVG